MTNQNGAEAASSDVFSQPSRPPPHLVETATEPALPRFTSWRDAFAHVDRAVSVKTPALRVRVSEPETTGGLMAKHITYLVRTEPYGYTVRRRFNDFCWLREVLVRRYTGMLIPSLPKKSVLGASMSNAGSEFVKNRMRLLGLFIENVVLMPFLRGDCAVEAFLSVQNEKDWDKARASVELMRDLLGDTSIGCTKWRQLVTDEVQGPSGSERIIVDMAKQTERLEQALIPLCAACKQLSERSAALTADMANLRSTFVEWQRIESELTNPNKWEYPNREGPTMVAVLTESTSLFEAWGRILEFQPLIMEHILHDSVQFLEGQCEALRDLFRAREKAIKEKVKLEKDLQQVVSDRSRTDAAGAANLFNGLLGPSHSHDDLVRMIKEKELQVSAYTRALFFSELDRFNADRAAVTKAVMSQLGACTVQYNKKVMGLWAEAVGRMGLDVEAGVEAAKSIMASTSSVRDV